MSRGPTGFWECVVSISPVLSDFASILTLVFAGIALKQIGEWKRQKKAETAAGAAWDLFRSCKNYAEFLYRSGSGHSIKLVAEDGKLTRVMPDDIEAYAEIELQLYYDGKNELYKKCTDQIAFFRMRVGDSRVEKAASDLMELDEENRLFVALHTAGNRARFTPADFERATKYLTDFVQDDAMRLPVKSALDNLESAISSYIRYD